MQRAKNLDAEWAKNKKLVYKMAHQVATETNKDYREVLTDIFLRFNSCLQRYSKKRKTRFSTYFMNVGVNYRVWYLGRATITDSDQQRIKYKRGNQVNVNKAGKPELIFDYVPDYYFWENIKNFLPEREFQILILKFVDGLSAREIAKIFNISKQRASQIYIQALDKLRKQTKFHIPAA